MHINVSQDAAKWYKEEFDLEDDAHIRFYVRYGFGGRIPGFSLAVGIDKPNSIYKSTRAANIVFFVEEKDAWYFEEASLRVDLNPKTNEPELTYE